MVMSGTDYRMFAHTFVVTWLQKNTDSLSQKHKDAQQGVSNQFSFFLFPSHAQPVPIPEEKNALCRCHVLDCACVPVILDRSFFSPSPPHLITLSPCQQRPGLVLQRATLDSCRMEVTVPKDGERDGKRETDCGGKKRDK